MKKYVEGTHMKSEIHRLNDERRNEGTPYETREERKKTKFSYYIFLHTTYSYIFLHILIYHTPFPAFRYVAGGKMSLVTSSDHHHF